MFLIGFDQGSEESYWKKDLAPKTSWAFSSRNQQPSWNQRVPTHNRRHRGCNWERKRGSSATKIEALQWNYSVAKCFRRMQEIKKSIEIWNGAFHCILYQGCSPDAACLSAAMVKTCKDLDGFCRTLGPSWLIRKTTQGQQSFNVFIKSLRMNTKNGGERLLGVNLIVRAATPVHESRLMRQMSI